MKRMEKITIALVLCLAVFVFPLVSANNDLEATVCCEETVGGLFCQDAPATECSPDARQASSACSSTSFCKQGWCFDSSEGTCLDNTPQNVCNAAEGTWSESFPNQCNLGCCTLGDQASFVTLTRCKALSGFLGLETVFDSSINSELQCVLSVQNQDRGACVYEFEFETTCEFTTREQCGGGGNGSLSGTFFKDTLCSAEELGTNCGPTTETTCVDGKDEVYFVDSCGNPANVYDAARVNDDTYWNEVIDVADSCDPSSSNANSQGCGNCDYASGSICRPAERGGTQPTYGENICVDLNCGTTSNGEDKRHGESWCVYNDHGSPGDSEQAVGSRFHRHVCVNGEEIVEACSDFRQEICIEDAIQSGGDSFSQAACRPNRWQDCIGQITQQDCENTDKRDCSWVADTLLGNVGEDVVLLDGQERGTCVPEYPPGTEFWKEGDAETLCAQVNTECIVKFEKKKEFKVSELFDGGFVSGDWECVENCECLEDSWWEDTYGSMCLAMADCGPNVNWLGEKGYDDGFNILNHTLEDAAANLPTTTGTTTSTTTTTQTTESNGVDAGAITDGLGTIQQAGNIISGDEE